MRELTSIIYEREREWGGIGIWILNYKKIHFEYNAINFKFALKWERKHY